MIAVAVQRTCSICGHRPSTCTTDWDGREVPSCDDCVAEVEYVAPVSELSLAARAVAFARENPGRTSQDISDALGLVPLASSKGGDRNAVSAALSRAVREGVIERRTDVERTTTYHPTSKPWSSTTYASGASRQRRRVTKRI